MLELWDNELNKEANPLRGGYGLGQLFWWHYSECKRPFEAITNKVFTEEVFAKFVIAVK